jgi:hypothetical protein
MSRTRPLVRPARAFDSTVLVTADGV